MIALLVTAALAAPTFDQPGDAGPARRWDVTDLRAHVQVDPTLRTVHGEVWHTVAPLGLPSDVVRLHQVALDIHAVDVDGVPVTGWRTGPDTLDIPVTPGAGHVVHVVWSARPQLGVHFRSRTSSRGIVEAWTQGEDEDNRHWIPLWDHPSDRYPVALTLEAPSDLVAVSNGALLSRGPGVRPGWTTWSYRLAESVSGYLLAFAVGEYATIDLGTTDRGDGVAIPLEVLAPRTLPPAVARRGMDAAVDVLPWLAARVGAAYPYPVYRQVLVQRFMYGAMENASTTISGDVFLVDDDLVALHDAENTVAHELAHQWFGDLVGNDGWRELWLNEGMATFWAARWMEHRYGAEVYADEVVGWMRSAGMTTPASQRAWATPDADLYGGTYSRAPMVLHMLRVWLGDALFDAAVARYVARAAGTQAETDDLRRAFEDVVGEDLHWFFDPLLHGTGAPTLATRWSESAGTLTVSVVQELEDRTPWLGPVTLAWADDDGVHRTTGTLTPGTATWERPARAVRWVMVDPAGGVLAHWTHKQPAASWSALLRESPDAYARLVALDELGDPEGDAEVAVPALAAALRGEVRLSTPATPDAWTVARRAARSLGKIATPEASDALRAALPTAPALVRAAIADALGDCVLSDATVTALDALVARDPSHEVVSSALRALAKQRPSQARTAALTTLARRDTSLLGDRHAAALSVLNRVGTAADLRVVLRFVADGRTRVQHAAGWAVVVRALADDAPDAAADDAARALLPWLTHEDFRTREAGVSLLARLGSDVAIAPLTAVRATTTVPSLRDEQSAAILRLRSGGAPAEPDDEVARALATLQALEDRLDELEQRLHGLERQ